MSAPSILIAEDEAIVAADLGSKLQRLGYGVAGTASGGEEAIRLARERQPSLVLMDVRLAGAMDGIAAAEAIRRELDLPVVFLTAYADTSTLERAKVTEPSGYITKPFEDSALRSTIEIAIYRHRAEQALIRARDQLEREVEARTADLRRAMELVRAERQRFHDVLDQLPAYLVLLSADYHVRFENRFFRERFGVSLGRRCYEYLFHRTEPCEVCESFRVVQTQAPHQWQWTGPDGRKYEIHDFPFKDVDGSQLVMEVGLDISDRIAAELERESLRNELARASRIATVGQLAASFAHELNQPLAAIVCNVRAIEQLMAQGPATAAEVQEALQDIAVDAKRAGEVIRQLRALCCKTNETRAALQFNEIIQETAQLLESEFVLRDVTVRLELDPQLPRVWGNAVELQQVVLNLITNAVEALRAGEPSLRRLVVSTRPESSQWIRASIQDSGPGLSEEQMRRIFEPFYTTKPGGMGMGLAICHSIIEAHGGRLWAENNPDQGATFHLTLPIAPAPPA